MSDHIITCDSLNFQAHTQTLSSEQMQHNELKYRSLVATLVRDLKPVRNEQTGNKLCVCVCLKRKNTNTQKYQFQFQYLKQEYLHLIQDNTLQSQTVSKCGCMQVCVSVCMAVHRVHHPQYYPQLVAFCPLKLRVTYQVWLLLLLSSR